MGEKEEFTAIVTIHNLSNHKDECFRLSSGFDRKEFEENMQNIVRNLAWELFEYLYYQITQAFVMNSRKNAMDRELSEKFQKELKRCIDKPIPELPQLV